MLAGAIDEAIPLEQQAIRLSPREPRIGWWYMVIGTVHLLQSRIDDAVVWLERARSDLPAATDIRSRLASAYALRGEAERAAAELVEVRRLSGGDLFSSIAQLQAGGFYSGWGVPKTRYRGSSRHMVIVPRAREASVQISPLSPYGLTTLKSGFAVASLGGSSISVSPTRGRIAKQSAGAIAGTKAPKKLTAATTVR